MEHFTGKLHLRWAERIVRWKDQFGCKDSPLEAGSFRAAEKKTQARVRFTPDNTTAWDAHRPPVFEL